jgi:hypothetical protein
MLGLNVRVPNQIGSRIYKDRRKCLFPYGPMATRGCGRPSRSGGKLPKVWSHMRMGGADQ